MSDLKYKNKGSEIRLKEQNGEVIGELTHHASMAITEGHKQILSHSNYLPTRPNVGGLYYVDINKPIYKGVYYVNFGKNNDKCRITGDKCTVVGGTVNHGSYLVEYSEFKTDLIPATTNMSVVLQAITPQGHKPIMIFDLNFYDTNKNKINNTQIELKCFAPVEILTLPEVSYIELTAVGAYSIRGLQVFRRMDEYIYDNIFTWTGSAWQQMKLKPNVTIYSKDGKYIYHNNTLSLIAKKQIECRLLSYGDNFKIQTINCLQSAIEGMTCQLYFYKKIGGKHYVTDKRKKNG